MGFFFCLHIICLGIGVGDALAEQAGG